MKPTYEELIEALRLTLHMISVLEMNAPFRSLPDDYPMDGLDKVTDLLARADERSICKTCGGSGMTIGWYPSYANPDNHNFDPAAEPCPDCTNLP